jgi:hypothetical protein
MQQQHSSHDHAAARSGARSSAAQLLLLTLQVEQVWLLPACIDWRHNFTHEQRDLPWLRTAVVQRHFEKVVSHLQARHLAAPTAAAAAALFALEQHKQQGLTAAGL